MKIITVAAGEGTRLADLSQIRFGINIPKPIFPVCGVPMISWSYRSFNRWITLGIVKPSDFIFVVRKDHDLKFNLVERIREATHPSVQFKVIDLVTSGPAETAFLGMSELEMDESVLINDCDHYFSAISMLKILNKNLIKENYIALSFTKPRSLVPNWSYISTETIYNEEFFKVSQIVEKDPNFENLENGLIGAYFFSSVQLFRNLFNSMDRVIGEKYVSKLISDAIKSQVPVYATKGKFGFPLGTQEDILDFENFFLDKSEYQFRDTTYIVDIDGVILKHDSGYHSLSEKYNDHQIVIHENLTQLKDLYKEGSSLILITSRPEKQRSTLEKIFMENKFKFDHLVMGVTDGIRYLINDRKPKDSYLDTAVAINTVRNFPFDIRNQNITHQALEVKNDLSSGSGAYTLRITDKLGKTSVRKIVYLPNLNLDASKVLDIQRKWYEAASEVIPRNIPKLLGFHSTPEFTSLEMEDISPSKSLSDIINSRISSKSIEKNISDFLEVMSILYQKTGKLQSDSNSDKFKFFIMNKSIPGIEALFKTPKFMKFDFINKKSLVVNGELFNNPILTLSNFAHNLGQNSGMASNLEALVHGDLTGENILVKSDGSVYLIDPLSTYLDNQKLFRNFSEGLQTSVIFDFMKLLQSFYAGYEKWSNSYTSAVLLENAEIIFNQDLTYLEDVQLIHKFSSLYENLGVNTSLDNIKMLCACMLFRLIPYRLAKNEISALYCLALGVHLLGKA